MGGSNAGGLAAMGGDGGGPCLRVGPGAGIGPEVKARGGAGLGGDRILQGKAHPAQEKMGEEGKSVK